MCSYPSPCDTCEKECNHKKGCDAWKIRTLTIWKQFNGYTKRRYKGVKKVQKFAYEHPDLLRKYLAEGPCNGCKIEKNCDNACGAYYAWWDARQAWQRFVWGMEK